MSEELFFDRYVLKEPPLGQGGMGKVYEAYDQKLGCRVAIKMMSSEVAANNEFRRRFYWEASAAAKFRDCANIVTIYDYDVAEGDQPFISMEFLDGQDLKARMQESSPLELPSYERRAFNFREKLETIVQVCRGLARAHSGEVFHRDIKPANIFLSREGPVKILDFGVARILDSTLTRENVALGTLPWMSPEQLRGQPVDGRSDIWSTGVVLYELLCHRRPFVGDQIALLRQIPSEAYPPLTRYLPACAKQLEEVVDRALAKDPAQRFTTANDMANSLEECIRLLDSQEQELFSEIENLQKLLRNWRSEAGDLQVPAILEGSVFTGEGNPDQTIPVWKVEYGTLLERHYEIFGWWQLIKDHPDRVTPVFELLSKSTQEFEKVNIPSCLESLKQVKSLDSRNAHVEMLEVECGWILGQPLQRRKELIDAKVRRWRAEQEKLEIYLKTRAILEEAETYLEEKDYQAGLEAAEKLLTLSPTHPEGLKVKSLAEKAIERLREVEEVLSWAKAAFEAGDYQACVEATDQGLGLEPEHDEIKKLNQLAKDALERSRRVKDLILQADQVLEANDYTLVLLLVREVLSLEPDHEEAVRIQRQAKGALERRQRIEELVASARAAVQAQDPEACLKATTEALELDSENVELLALQQQAQEILDLRVKVEESLTQAKQTLKAEDFKTALQLADEVLNLRAEDEEALNVQKTAREALERQERIAELLTSGQAAFEAGECRTSLRLTQQGLKLDPENSELAKLRGRSQEALDKIQTIKELLAQAHQLLEANDETGVLQIVEEVLALDSQNLEASQLKKEIAARSENREREQKVLVLLAAAQEAHQAGNYEACLRSTREALTLSPGHPEVRELDRLAIEALETNRRVEAVLKEAQKELRTKDYVAAVKTAQKALELQPEDEYALQIGREAAEAIERQEKISELLEKAHEHWASQDYENCLEAVQEGLQIDPRHAELRKLRKQAQEILEKNRKIEQLLAEANEALQDEDYSVTQKRVRAILKLESDHPEALRISETAEKGARRRQRLNKILTSAQQSLEKKQYQSCLDQVQEGLGVEPQNEGLLRLQQQAQEALERLQSIDALLEQAQELLKQRKDDSVLEKVRDILSLDPENEKAVQLRKKAVVRLEAREREERVGNLLTQAEEAYRQGNFQSSLQATTEALVLAPDHTEAKKLDQQARKALEKDQRVQDLVARAHRLRATENYRAALEAIQQAVVLQPDLEELKDIQKSTAEALARQETLDKLRTKANELYESGDHHGCLKACREGLKVEPKERDLLKLDQLAAGAIKRKERFEELLERGRQALDQADFSRALGFSEQALTIDPNNQEALRMQKGAKQEAERRQKIDSFLFSARQLFEAKEYSKCLQAVESGLKLEGENSELSELLDRAQQSLEQQRRIRELLSQARELLKGANDREVVVTAKELLALDPQNSEGLQLLEKAQARIRARERKEKVDQILAKVRKAYQAGEFQKCLEASEEALALEPDYPEVTEFQIRAQGELDQLEKQGRLLKAARKKLEAQNFSGAIDQAQAVLLLKPRQPDALKIQHQAEEGLERQRRADELLTSAEAAFEVENYKACLEAVAQGLEVQPEQVRLKQLQRLARRALQKREKTMSSLLDKAKTQLKLENFRKALTLTQDILALDPDHREAIEIQEMAKDRIEQLGPDLEPGLWESASRPVAIVAAILIMAFAVYQLLIVPARELSTLVVLAQESFEAGEYPAAQLRITEGLNLDPEHPDLLRLDVEVKKALEQAAVPTVAPGILSLNILPWAKVDSILRKDDKKEFADDPNNSCPESPCVVSLPPGEYHVKVSNPHFDSLEFDINISSGVFHTETRPLAGFNPDNEIPRIVGN